MTTASPSGGWKGLAADLQAATDTDPTPAVSAALPSTAPPRPSAAVEPTTVAPTAATSRRSRRRRSGAPFTEAHQLVGLWLPHNMADELRRRAEAAGISNSEYAREIFRREFTQRP